MVLPDLSPDLPSHGLHQGDPLELFTQDAGAELLGLELFPDLYGKPVLG
jgi:hypothetical protein